MGLRRHAAHLPRESRPARARPAARWSCVIPERVYEEVVETGLKQGYPDARRIERSIDADRFDIVSVETTALLSRLQVDILLRVNAEES